MVMIQMIIAIVLFCFAALTKHYGDAADASYYMALAAFSAAIVGWNK